jgi:solute carrier family 35 protein E3
MLLVVGPFIDQAVSQQWIANYTWTTPALQQLLLSCGLAVLVNVSQFMCLGRFSAVTFQVR